MSSALRRPPYDPEVAAVLAALGTDLFRPITPDTLVEARARSAEFMTEDLSRFDVERRDVTVPGHEGAELTLSVFSKPGHQGAGPGIYHIHGGGMVVGDRLTGVSLALPWVERYGAVLTTIEYRLAPENPDPYPVEDCYAGLTWVAGHAAELGIDARRLIVLGGSAGGGLAAGTALLARDRGGPALSGQMLLCPMLDDRDATVSARQFDGLGVWDRQANLAGWGALLGDRRGTADVSPYAAPARATDLGDLPPTFIDAGSAEVFRDEAVAYASGIWAAGGVAELHIWPGGTHGWDSLIPNSPLAAQAAAARHTWAARILGD